MMAEKRISRRQFAGDKAVRDSSNETTVQFRDRGYLERKEDVGMEPNQSTKEENRFARVIPATNSGGSMSETLAVRIIMASDVDEERVRGIEYSRDPSRLGPMENGRASFRGDHGIHSLEKKAGVWRCSCRSYRRLRQLTDCRHIIAAQRILQPIGSFANPIPVTESVGASMAYSC
jgi:hypothetical protein